jgi:hypothetical protein
MTSTTTTTPARNWQAHPATDKQLGLIASQLRSKALNPAIEAALRDQIDEGLTKGQASAMIELLFLAPGKNTDGTPAAPTAPPARRVAPTEPGVYEREDTVYQVVRSGTGRLYAKALTERLSHVRRLTETGQVVHATFEYDSGAIWRLDADDRVSPERARELGQLTSFCCACGAKLADADSVTRGMGPVCAKKYA